MTLDVNILQLGQQVAFSVKKRHNNAIFRCSWFQKVYFVCLLLMPMIGSPKTVNIFIWALSQLSGFEELKYIPPFFWPEVTNHKVKSKF